MVWFGPEVRMNDETREEEEEEEKERVRRCRRFSFLIFGACTVIAGGLAIYYGWNWLALNEPESSQVRGCVGLYSPSACVRGKGERQNMANAIIFGGCWLGMLVCLFVFWLPDCDPRPQKPRPEPDRD